MGNVSAIMGTLRRSEAKIVAQKREMMQSVCVCVCVCVRERESLCVLHSVLLLFNVAVNR